MARGSDKDGCYGVWQDAKIVFDQNGAAERLRVGAGKIIAEGKKGLSDLELTHARFDAEDQLRAIKKLAEDDLPAANYALHRNVSSLVELFFDIERLWTPPPKKTIPRIGRTHPKLGALLESFYSSEVSFVESVRLAEEIIQEIFDKRR